MAKKVQLNPYRFSLQLLIAALLAYLLVRPRLDDTYTADFEAYCPFGGLQAFSSFMVNNSLACSMTTTQIFMGLGLVAAIILFSKLFCSYLCPIGSFTEWLARQGRRLKLNFKISGLTDRLLRVVKYALLFVTFYFTVTSSELFCKTFDPYYAVFSGFSRDVVLSYAVMALLLAIPGSFFVNQFWCRYACPLGAASNIFSHSYVFIALIGIYVLLTQVFNVALSWLWLLGALTLAGVLFETFKVGVKGFSVFRVKRNTESCTNCRLCDKACPMAIKVSALEKVNDIDCHACGDCVASCPEKNTLALTRHNWMPAAVVVVLVALGLAFAERIHIPTISMKWGSEKKMQEAGIYDQEGLTSIKCYGSSMSFASHMKEVPGVLGVETYVGSHSVRVWYDKAVLDNDRIREKIFTPVKQLYDVPGAYTGEVAVCEAAIDNFFDPGDAGLLSTRLSQCNGFYAMQTLFGEPVHAMIYYDPLFLDINRIKDIIEDDRVEWTVDGKEYAARTAFKVATIRQSPRMPVKEYLAALYSPVSLTFNDYAAYAPGELAAETFDFQAAADPALTDMPWYLLSHLSNNRAIVKFETVPTNSGFKLQLEILKNKITRPEILSLLNADSLRVHLSDGTTQTLKNPYRF